MRILFLCNKSPYPPKEGGPIAMNMFIRGLVDQGHQVKVLAVNSWKYNIVKEQIPEEYISETGIELIDVDLRLKPLNALFALLTSRSYHIERFKSKKFALKVKEILNQQKFDIVQLESVFMGPYIPVIRSFSDAKIVLRAHNIEHLIWYRIAGETKNRIKQWYLHRLALSLKKYEEDICRNVNGIVPITRKDAEFFIHHAETLKTHGSKAPEIEAIPFGILAQEKTGRSKVSDQISLFSLGSMNWIPNQEGIKWFLDKVWPDINRQFPELRYFIAGRAMPEWLLRFEGPNIIISGEIEDASRFISEHSIMIVPLFSGSGIRIKIIEGMAAGKAIISTSLGAEGIEFTDKENILIADSPCDFFEMISICLNDPGLIGKLGENARRLIFDLYHPEILIGKLVAFYKRLS